MPFDLATGNRYGLTPFLPASGGGPLTAYITRGVVSTKEADRVKLREAAVQAMTWTDDETRTAGIDLLQALDLLEGLGA